MRKYENECVGCPAEMGCLGNSCPYINVPRDYCDICGEEGAKYRIYGDDYCEDCIKEYLQDMFNDLTIMEKAKLLKTNISKINSYSKGEKRMIVIMGESGSGKTTLLNLFIGANPKYHKIITYTTRPIREGETDGVDYHFVSQAAFDEFVKRGFFAEHTKYRDWSYGIAKTDCESDNAITILTPAGCRTLKQQKYDVVSIYLYVDRRSRLINILARGDDVDEAYRRNLSDVGQFDGVEQEADYIINNQRFHMNELQTVRSLRSIIDNCNK